MFCISVFSQPLPEPTETGPTALNGLRESITVFSDLIDGYWDYSTQVKSTFAGLGDSTNLSVATWQSNDRDLDVWTLVTTDTLSTIVDESALLLEVTDFTGLWMKYVILSLSLDSMSIETYQVKKKFKLF